jgi:hypothetical protein
MRPSPSDSEMQTVSHREAVAGSDRVPRPGSPRPILHCIVRKGAVGPVPMSANARVSAQPLRDSPLQASK